LISLGLLWIIFAVIQDLKKREISNWTNFSLVIFALGFRFFWSLFNSGSGGNFNFFYQGLIGFGIFFVLGNVFYYSRVFAGGDAKLMIALGAIIPLYDKFIFNVELFLVFLVLFIFSGAIFGLFSSLFLIFKNFRSFKERFNFRLRKDSKKYLFVFLIGVLIMLMGFFNLILIYFGVLVFIFPYLYVSAKAIEDVCMIKKVPSGKLTEGDWLKERVKVGKKYIEPSWDGLSKEEIALIKKHNKFVYIKQGIPFSPTFFLGFVFFILYFFGVFGNFLF